jgi:endonuclease/exonuclease/phosphatase family metal-dependent hydrolase
MKLRSTVLGLTVVGLLASAAGAQEYVRPSPPVFTPNGDVATPWSTIGLGLWGSVSNERVVLNAGDYFEPGIINPPHPVILESTGGAARIAVNNPQRTTLRVASYNTHLFGLDPIIGLPRWQDQERAPHIGRVANAENADIFLFQEVWDPALYETIRGITLPVYPSGFYGGNREGSSLLNSGLYTVSKHPVFSVWQFYYGEEDGFFEAMASKGYIRTVINKDGFTIAVFNTHTQSGMSEGNLEARASQLAQLSVDVMGWRIANPSHVVVVAGDFNVVDFMPEYFLTMKTLMGDALGAGDGGANMPVVDGPGSCTTCYENDLRQYFDPDNLDNWRLDYMLYAGSLDGSVRVVPKSHVIRKYQIPAGYSTICDDGICTRDLSDHYGVVMDLELQRY